MNYGPKCKDCRHYSRIPFAVRVDMELATGRALDPSTCSNCGGDENHGPSCLCPVFGEDDG